MARHDMMRIAGTAVALGAGAMLLSGCMGSPTYGTDKTASEQFLEDLGAAATIRGPQGSDIEYRPRPDLVTPPNDSALPPPQTSVAASEQWPESPEQTRERLRAQADLSGGTAGFQGPRSTFTGDTTSYPPTVGGAANGPPRPGSQNDAQARQRYLAAQEVARASNPTRRNFLSEPPLEYRQPAATAPVGEFGESERTKESRRSKIAERPGSQRRWWPF